MIEINELIGWAENGINMADNREIPTGHISIMGYLGAIACSLLAQAKLMNRKVCVKCRGLGYGIQANTKVRSDTLVMVPEPTEKEAILCPTCKGRGRV